jgi:hypothetical protein
MVAALAPNYVVRLEIQAAVRRWRLFVMSVIPCTMWRADRWLKRLVGNRSCIYAAIGF